MKYQKEDGGYKGEEKQNCIHQISGEWEALPVAAEEFIPSSKRYSCPWKLEFAQVLG